jgi:Flp pilus assembly protein TadG
MIRTLRHYWKSKQGMAAVEFAFVLPILVTMLLGLVELSQAMLIRSDVSNMASVGANLIAEEKSVTSTDITNVFNAVGAMLFPFNLTTPDPAHPGQQLNIYSVTLTSVADGGAAGSPRVAWSCTQYGTAETKGGAPSKALPNGPDGTPMITPGDGTSVIWARVTYKYTSPLSYFMTGSRTWTNDFYLKPRRVLQVPITGAPAGCNT